MKKSECKCCHCSNWVNCKWFNGKPYGFCLTEDLFTYTCKFVDEDCSNFEEGTPITEEEWEEENDPTTW